MTHWQTLGEENRNMTEDLVPHRDKIVGLDDKRQPHHLHTDAKSYEIRKEKVPEDLLRSEEGKIKKFE